MLITSGALTLNYRADNGMLTGTTLGAIETNQTYTPYGELDTYNATYNNYEFYKDVFTYDVMGRIETKISYVTGSEMTYEYFYDEIGQLEEVKENGITVRTYEYDSNGNRVKFTEGVKEVIGVYDEQDRLTSYGDIKFVDYGTFKMKVDNGISSSYYSDQFGNLNKVRLDNKFVEYVHDAKGRRVSKKVNGVITENYIYEGKLNPVAITDGSGNIVSRFIYGDKSNVPSYMIKNEKTYRIISDYLGSPILVMDVETKDIIQSINYDEFGRIVSDSNPGFQPFGFAGGIYDQDTKLIKFRS